MGDFLDFVAFEESYNSGGSLSSSSYSSGGGGNGRGGGCIIIGVFIFIIACIFNMLKGCS